MINQKDVQVSICCLAYNHEKYIRQALEGFVNQKTNFRYEIIIHDDASKDATPQIIREYCDKYPDLFVPILQKENQVSQGGAPNREFVFPRVRGKYIAYCEGDDFWTDCNKLQKQYDFLEENPEYSACFHNALLNNLSNEKLNYVFPGIKEDKDFSVEEIVLGDGGLFATNSIFAKKEILIDMPVCFRAKGFSDYQWSIYSALSGKVRCFKDVMSVYNCGTYGSWTQAITTKIQAKLFHYHEKEQMLMRVDDYTQQKYHDSFMKKIYETRFYIYYFEGNKKALKEIPYKYMWKKKLSLFLQSKMPWLYKIVRFFLDKVTKVSKI